MGVQVVHKKLTPQLFCRKQISTFKKLKTLGLIDTKLFLNPFSLRKTPQDLVGTFVAGALLPVVLAFLLYRGRR